MRKVLALFVIAAVISGLVPWAHAQSYGQITSALKDDAWQVHVNKQVQIAADLTSGLNRDQPFAYIVQVLDQNGVVIQLSWLTGTLTAGQSLSPSQSWTPAAPGNYTAQIFVWSGIDNPNALSPPLTMKISVT